MLVRISNPRSFSGCSAAAHCLFAVPHLSWRRSPHAIGKRDEHDACPFTVCLMQNCVRHADDLGSMVSEECF